MSAPVGICRLPAPKSTIDVARCSRLCRGMLTPPKKLGDGEAVTPQWLTAKGNAMVMAFEEPIELPHVPDLHIAAQPTVVQIPIGEVRPGHSVRLGAVKTGHVDLLAELDGQWPPILVSRADMSIIDGHYRYLAARQLNYTHVDCVLFEGDESGALVESIRRNVQHGLPLTLSERTQAAGSILRRHPDRSDRWIGELCALSHGTVGRLRRTITSPAARDDEGGRRRGRDGKLRPVAPGAARERIVRELRAHPGASLREIARLAGSSHETVRSVRDRDMGPLEEAPVCAPPTPNTPPAPLPTADAAFMATESGSDFARWFTQTTVGDDSYDFIAAVPLNRIYEIADEARRRAAHWTDFAVALTARLEKRRARA